MRSLELELGAVRFIVTLDSPDSVYRFDFDQFKEQLKVAISKGASGFLAGRAVWQDVGRPVHNVVFTSRSTGQRIPGARAPSLANWGLLTLRIKNRLKGSRRTSTKYWLRDMTILKPASGPGRTRSGMWRSLPRSSNWAITSFTTASGATLLNASRWKNNWKIPTFCSNKPLNKPPYRW